MTEPTNEEKALGWYLETPVVRAIAQIVTPIVHGVPVPVGAAADNVVQKRYAELVARKRRTFIDEFSKQSTTITVERLGREDDLVRVVMVIVEAVDRANRTEKVRLFARLLSNYDTIVVDSKQDDFDEMLQILDEMTVREYQILLILRAYEKREAEQRKTDPSILSQSFWHKFVGKIEKKGIPRQEMTGTFERLSRTGCFRLITSVSGATGEIGETTPRFDRFLRAVKKHHEVNQ